MDSPRICMICLEVKEVLSNISDSNSAGLCSRFKLEKCIPEIDWKHEYSICSNCSEQLQNAYTFRERCIKSEHTRTELWEKMILELQNKSKSKTKEGSDSFKWLNTCQNVVEDDTVSAVEKIPKKTKLEKSGDFYCKYCSKRYARRNMLMKHQKNCDLLKDKIDNPEEIKKDAQLNDGNLESIISSKNDRQKSENCDSIENAIDIPEEMKTGAKPNEEDDRQQSVNYDLIDEEIDTPEEIKEAEPNEDNNRPSGELNKCDLCAASFNNKYLLKRHRKNVHATEKNFKCNLCPSSFVSSVYLNAHKKYHSGDRTHVCLFCGKTFITASDLYHHEKIHKNKRAYKCADCDKAFNTSSDLHKHKICVHMDRNLWKYSCEYCSRKFPLKTNLNTHIKTHTGEKNFSCHLCDKKCISRSALTRHIDSHTNVKSFKCELCNLGYKYKKSMEIHMVKSHGVGDVKIPDKVKKYFCHLCPKSYYANSKLEKHLRSHTGDRPFKCPNCDKRFVDKSYIKQHLRLAHNEDV